MTKLLVMVYIVLSNQPALCDTTPPELINLVFNPSVIDCSSADQAIVVTFTLRDDLSGITTGGLATYATFYSPSHQQYRHASVTSSNLISGSVNDGIFETTCVFPQYSETGTWNITTVRVVDNVGNMRDYATEELTAMGIPTDLTVEELSNELPIANAGPDQLVFGEVTLAGSASSDADGTITSWEWTLTHRTNSSFNRTTSGEKPTVSNLAAGFYDVTLTVTDNSGATDTDSMLSGAAGTWDVSGDGKLGLAEIIYVLQTLSGMRP